MQKYKLVLCILTLSIPINYITIVYLFHAEHNDEVQAFVLYGSIYDDTVNHC